MAFLPGRGNEALICGGGAAIGGCVDQVGAAFPFVNDGHGDYVFVPAGAFQMGDNFGDGESRERPVHTVEFDAFYIGKYEMTNGEWKKFRDDPVMTMRSSGPAGEWSRKIRCRTGPEARNHGGGRPTATISGARRELGFGYGLLQLAEREDRQEIPSAHGSRVGEGRARDGSAAVSMGQ